MSRPPVGGDVHERLPDDAPPPKGKPVTFTHYFDANLMFDLLTGRSVTGIIHIVNQTPFDWYCKKQATSETATYGSEFVAARTCTEQIIDIRTTFRYLGVPIKGKSYMFGDNDSVIKSSMHIDAKLHKRHVALSFHRVRESVAAGIITLGHIRSKLNPSDILSKFWTHNSIWGTLQPLLFWKGDTMECYSPEDNSKAKNVSFANST